jgi:hypothetical protein
VGKASIVFTLSGPAPFSAEPMETLPATVSRAGGLAVEIFSQILRDRQLFSRKGLR